MQILDYDKYRIPHRQVFQYLYYGRALALLAHLWIHRVIERSEFKRLL